MWFGPFRRDPRRTSPQAAPRLGDQRFHLGGKMRRLTRSYRRAIAVGASAAIVVAASAALASASPASVANVDHAPVASAYETPDAFSYQGREIDRDAAARQ